MAIGCAGHDDPAQTVKGNRLGGRAGADRRCDEAGKAKARVERSCWAQISRDGDFARAGTNGDDGAVRLQDHRPDGVGAGTDRRGDDAIGAEAGVRGPIAVIAEQREVGFGARFGAATGDDHAIGLDDDGVSCF